MKVGEKKVGEMLVGEKKSRRNTSRWNASRWKDLVGQTKSRWNPGTPFPWSGWPIRPFPVVKIKKFFRIRVPRVEKPLGTKNQPIWRTFWKLDFFTLFLLGTKQKKWKIFKKFFSSKITKK
jgi:hypothetical protein